MRVDLVEERIDADEVAEGGVVFAGAFVDERGGVDPSNGTVRWPRGMLSQLGYPGCTADTNTLICGTTSGKLTITHVA